MLVNTGGTGNLFRPEELQPIAILIVVPFLLTIHRYFGSAEYVTRLIPSVSTGTAAVFMFASAFVLLGLVPLAIVLFLFRKTPRDYGVQLGDWKWGLKALAVVLPIILAVFLYPASQTPDIRDVYPLNRNLEGITAAFLNHEVGRGILF